MEGASRDGGWGGGGSAFILEQMDALNIPRCEVEGASRDGGWGGGGVHSSWSRWTLSTCSVIPRCEVEGASRDGVRGGGGSAFILEQMEALNMQRDTQV